MKVEHHAGYDAAFVRAADHDDLPPEELARKRLRRKRLVRLAVVVATIVVIAIAAFVVYQLRRDTPARQVERGIAYGKADSHVAAIIEYKRSLQEEPDQPTVRVLLGRELSLLNDAKAAEIEFQKAADAKYRPDETLPLLTTSLLHQGKFERVIEVVDSTSIESPDSNAELLAARGSAYFALGREAEAEKTWHAADDFVANHPAVLLARARARAAKNDFDGAERLLRGIAPEAAKTEVLTFRGDMARATGKPDDAKNDYEAALRFEPGNLLVRSNLAQTLVELKRYDEASVQVRKVLGQMPNYPNGHFIAALVAIGRKDLPAANDAVKKAVQSLPSDGRYQLLAGTLAYQLGDPTAAEQYLSAAVLLLPQNVDARRLLALVYIDRHESAKANEVFAPVFAAFRKDRDVAGIAARIALDRGDANAAAHAFDQVDPADPQNVDATLLAASLKLAVGDRAGGFARLRAAAAARPDDADVNAALVIAHLTLRETADAATEWKVLEKREPDAARTWNLLAAIALARGDKPAARAAMERAAAADPRYLAPVSGLAMLDIGDNRLDDAKQRLRRFVAANPDVPDATRLLIAVERKAGASDDVILGLLRDAQKANPKSPQVVMALANYATAHGDLGQAQSVVEHGLTFAPDDPALLLFVGEQALAAGDNDRAIDAFTRLTNENAASADYPTRLGVAQIRAGNFEAALTAFRQALSRQPNNPERHYAMVHALLDAGKPDEAVRTLFEIRHLSSRSPVIGELDADIKFAARQFPEAIVGYQHVLAQQPGSRVVMKTYEALNAAHRRPEAVRLIDDWLAAHPKDEQVRLFDADLAMHARDFTRATNDLRVVATAHPTDALLLNNLAWNLGQLGDPEALTVAEKAHGLAPDNPAIADTLGWMLVEKGDAARGLTLIEAAARAAPKELDIRLHLAKAQIRQGRKDAARATLQGLVAASPDSEQAQASKTLLATL